MKSGKKVALLVGVGEYGNGLKSLQCPANGVTEFQTILAQPEIGGFDEVVPLINPDVGTMRTRIGAVFSRLKKADLGLFYFTGHGIKDMTGEFYLTTSQTQLLDNGRLNPGTAVEASFLKSILGNCYAQRKVVILDCCFGAAFAEGFLTMDSGGVDVEAQLGGEGWVVLTAATARNYALEQAGEALSVYTRYLVEGLKTPEKDRTISLWGICMTMYALRCKPLPPPWNRPFSMATKGMRFCWRGR
ncbi:MAG: caspase family protein [Leptolyngbya sp. SIO1D8]|nr:caspase family protein [Leptolyngbya sp. SIO1D8]